MNRIREIRDSLKISRQALANKANISMSYLYDLERHRYSPTIEVAHRIAAALGKRLDEVFPPDKGAKAS